MQDLVIYIKEAVYNYLCKKQEESQPVILPYLCAANGISLAKLSSYFNMLSCILIAFKIFVSLSLLIIKIYLIYYNVPLYDIFSASCLLCIS